MGVRYLQVYDYIYPRIKLHIYGKITIRVTVRPLVTGMTVRSDLWYMYWYVQCSMMMVVVMVVMRMRQNRRRRMTMVIIIMMC